MGLTPPPPLLPNRINKQITNILGIERCRVSQREHKQSQCFAEANFISLKLMFRGEINGLTSF